MRIFGTIVCAWALASGQAIASGQTSKVGSVAGDNYGGSFAFWLTGTRSGKPTCATDDNWSIPNSSSDSAKALLSMLLTAFASGKTVQVQGTGVCDPTAPTRETVSWMIITN